MSDVFSHLKLRDKRVLAIIPDKGRTAPIPLVFLWLRETLRLSVAALQGMVVGYASSLQSPAGVGINEDSPETPRVPVTWATGIPRERYEYVNLGSRDPSSIGTEAWAGRECQAMLLVPHAVNQLYRLSEARSTSLQWTRCRG